MPSRQDQLHSYQFMVQRVVAALVMRDTDPAQSPFRRIASATLAGVVFAALGLAGAAVYGALRGGSAEGWRDANAVIIERESGAKYVYRDNKLHPVLNYASALLIVGSATPNVMTVSRSKLAGVPRGRAYGIPKAPDALPDKGNLQSPPWTVCSVPDTTSGGGNGTQSVLSIQRRVDAGRSLDDSKALLVSAPGGEVYLLWRSHRYRIRDRDVVLPALAWNAQARTPVATAMLNTLALGADIARVQLPAARRASRPRAPRSARCSGSRRWAAPSCSRWRCRPVSPRSARCRPTSCWATPTPHRCSASGRRSRWDRRSTPRRRRPRWRCRPARPRRRRPRPPW